MKFNFEDENYIYGVIGKNVKKYRKLKKLTQAQLAEKIDYSLSFVSGLESKKHQTFSLGALWRISLILGVDMYKLCIDEDKEKEKPKFLTFSCENCDYKTEIPIELIELVEKANEISTSSKEKEDIHFKCPKCANKLIFKA